MKKFEVLSPAGDLENLKIAIKSGADAVYFGLNKFNARLKAGNIDIDNLESIVDYAHLKGVKAYVTINTLVSDSELKELVEMVGKCLAVGVDAFIVQDYGVIYVLKSVYPNIVLHGSTQLGVHNVRGARVAKRMGLSRVVLSREVTLEDIREIARNVDIELEVFVQGAMCVCFSGNCYLSSLKFGASGNRGLCKQLCRLPYTLSNGRQKKSGYMISPRDNCMLDHLQELCDIGVVSFKIEGRLRRGGYVATATRVYRNAIDSIINKTKFDNDTAKSDLKKVFSRGEFVSGYFDGKDIIDIRYNSHMGEKIGKVIRSERFKDLYKILIDCNVELHGGDGLKFVDDNNQIITLGVGNIEKLGSNVVVYGKNLVKANSEVYRILDSEFEGNIVDLSKRKLLDINVSLSVGDPIRLSVKCDNLWEVNIDGQVVQVAKNTPITKEKIIENLSKVDRDIFEISNINFDKFDDNAFVAVSAINEIRRGFVDKLSNQIINSIKVKIDKCDLPENIVSDSPLVFIAIIDERFNIAKCKNEYSKFVLSPNVYSVETIKNFYEMNKSVLKNRLVINLPVVALKDDLKIIDDIVNYAISQDIAIMVNNIYGLDYISDGVRVIASHNMNCSNSYALTNLKRMGVDDVVFSCEKWTARTQGTYKLGSGKRVLMTFAHCPSVTLNGTGCANVCGVYSCGQCKYTGELNLRNDNNVYTIRRYKVHNCYFELVDEFREDNMTAGVVVDLRN